MKPKKKSRSYLASFFLALSVVIVIGVPAVLILSRVHNRSESNQNPSEPRPSGTETLTDSSAESSGTETFTGSAGESSGTDPNETDQTAGQPLPSDPSPEQELLRRRAEEIMEDMTLAEKAGQMFFVRCPEKDAAELVTNCQPAGFILFAADFEGRTKSQVTEAIKSYQSAAKLPLLIGTDEEGGTVTRVSRFKEFRPSPFLSPRDLFEEGGWDLICSDTLEKCELLKSLGINVNLAPVCDVSTSEDDFIYKRAFSNDAEEVSEFVRTAVGLMKEQNMGSTLKHFPGYGNNVDTHTGIAVDTRDLSQFRGSDFLPFQAGIEAGAGSVLVSHNIMTCVDSDQPASLSPAVHELLRNELGFDGVIMTDDLIMDAITQYTDGKTAAVQAVIAGNDLLICSDCEEQLPAVIAAVKDGTITEERLEESVLRVLIWKLSLGLIK